MFSNDVILSCGLHFNLSCTCINAISEQSVPVCCCNSGMLELDIFLATRRTLHEYICTHTGISQSGQCIEH